MKFESYGGKGPLKPLWAIVLAVLFAGVPVSHDTLAQEPSPSPALSEASAKRLQRLKEQADRSPGNQAFLYDYLQALEEAGRDTEILALRTRLDAGAAPASVLARMGRAAANQKQYPMAVELFQQARNKAPGSVDVLSGLAYALVDNGQPAEAQKVLEAQTKILNSQRALLDPYAEALRAQHEDAQALRAYQRILELDPADREAKRNEILTVARLGAPHRAVELAEKSQGLVSDEELASIKSDRAVATARWGLAGDRNAPGRFAATDAALAENEQLLAKATDEERRRLRFDRVTLLRDRVRMQEAADYYEKVASD